MKEDARTAVKPHEFEHAEPTVIHDPEADMTILARWLHRGMQQGPKFWYLVAGSVLAVIVATMVANGLSAGKSTTGKAWSDLAFAQTPGQKVDIAGEFVNTEAGRVARLQAASDYFMMATRDLPNNRESAQPLLKKALDLFQEVAREAPERNSPEAVTAAFAAARTLEARNELTEAVVQYKAVSSGWPGTPEAKQAEALATQLQDKDVIDFYSQLYKPTSPPPLYLPRSTGPSGFGSIPGMSGGIPPGHPSLTGPTIPAPPLSTMTPLPPGLDLLKPSTPKASTPGTVPAPTYRRGATRHRTPASDDAGAQTESLRACGQDGTTARPVRPARAEALRRMGQVTRTARDPCPPNSPPHPPSSPSRPGWPARGSTPICRADTRTTRGA